MANKRQMFVNLFDKKLTEGSYDAVITSFR